MKVSVRGFTIVELLIVIVVIAILAAISIVAYNGITNRANDSTVKADLATFAKKVEIFKADNSDFYPNLDTEMDTVDAKFSKNAYAVGPSQVTRNVLYCIGAGREDYTLLAMSKSGQAFAISSSNQTPTEYSTTWDASTTSASLCSGLGLPYYALGRQTGYSHGNTPSEWEPWTNVE